MSRRTQIGFSSFLARFSSKCGASRLTTERRKAMLQRFLLAERSFKSVMLVLGICLFSFTGITMMVARDFNRAFVWLAIFAACVFFLVREREKR
jgi:hypothetical protein